MVDDGDELPSGGRDLVVLSLEVDGVVVIDAARGAQGEVEIEHGRGWAGPHVCALIKGLGLPDLGGNLGCGWTRGAVLAGQRGRASIIDI